MIKLNLLEAKPVYQEGGIHQIKESDILSDENFLDQEEEAPTTVEEAPAGEVKMEASATPSPQPVTEESEEEEPSEFIFKPKAKFPLVPVLVVVFLALAVGGYFWVSKRSGTSEKTSAVAKKSAPQSQPTQSKIKPQNQGPTAVQPEVQSSESTQSSGASSGTGAVVPALPAEVKAQRNSGAQAVNLLGKVLSSVPKGARIGFLSFDGQIFTLELFASKKTSLDAFLKTTSASIPALTLKVLAKNRDYFQGRRLPHLLVSGELNASGSVEPGISRLTAGSIAKDLRDLARKHGVRMRELRIAAPFSESGQKYIPVTMKVSGVNQSIQPFLTDLLKQYGNLGVSRLFVNASRGGTVNQLDVAANLNVFIE